MGGDSLTEVKVKEKAESVILPCRTKAVLNKDTLVEWTRSEPYFGFVHVFPNTSNHYRQQDDLYCARTEMNVDLLQTGDLSLTLKYPTDRDSGSYICTIYRDQDILRQRVVLHHVKEERFPIWAIVLLISLPLLSMVAGGAIFLFWFYLRTVPKVEVESGSKSVELPFKTNANLPEDAKVEWRDEENWTAHVFQNGAEQPNQQSWYYRGRTEMRPNALKDKDLSLTLKYPTKSDFLTCTVYSKEGKILLRGEVLLQVKVPEVVEPGEVSVELPCKLKDELKCEVTEVVWVNSRGRMVHRYDRDKHPPEEQFYTYRHQTELKTGFKETGDFSLTIKYPTDWDNKFYTCKAYREDTTILMKKRVKLRVKECQVEVQGASVQLPFQTTPELLQGCRTVYI
ncbi:uncharacterized protein LOC119779053 [Cyprinodon tularosa]|uniref:uncharacterized protein LOC119779053 n=1 Tax=Cyprinodon tularosa TaxID=77115 RepID=UPI0018E28C5A|nr:uncharacterized protein LOC119779053 [Cyprinodon tularosa]